MMIRNIDFEEASKQFKSASPYPSIVFDDFLCPEAAEKVANAFPTFEEAQRLGRGFPAVNERRKYQVTDAELFPEPIRMLHEELQSDSFIEKLRILSGYNDLVGDRELIGGGMHQTGPRGHLDVHIDFNYIKHRQLHRRLNILVFFNRDWREEWGGKTELWDSNVRELKHSYSPIFNRCVIFETSEISWHGVSAVTCPEGVSRKSFAGYYYTPCSAEEVTKNYHSTVFKARPDEYSKRYLYMPLQHVWDQAVRPYRYVMRKLGRG